MCLFSVCVCVYGVVGAGCVVLLLLEGYVQVRVCVDSRAVSEVGANQQGWWDGGRQCDIARCCNMSANCPARANFVLPPSVRRGDPSYRVLDEAADRAPLEEAHAAEKRGALLEVGHALVG